MLKSLVVSVSTTKFSALAFTSHLKESLKKVKELGFDGVELAVRDPALLNKEELKDLLAENKLSGEL